MGFRLLFVAELDFSIAGEQGRGDRQPGFVGDEHERDNVFGKLREGRRFVVVFDAQGEVQVFR